MLLANRTLSPRQHAIMDAVMGATLLATPLILKPKNRYTLAGIVPVLVGAGTLVQRAMTRYDRRTSGEPSKLGLRSHLVADTLTGAALAMSPWLLGFSRRSWLPHVLLGAGELVAALVTRYDRNNRNVEHFTGTGQQQGHQKGQPGNPGRQDRGKGHQPQPGHGQVPTTQSHVPTDDHGQRRMESYHASGAPASDPILEGDLGTHAEGFAGGHHPANASATEWNTPPMANAAVLHDTETGMSTGAGISDPIAGVTGTYQTEEEAGRRGVDQITGYVQTMDRDVTGGGQHGTIPTATETDDSDSAAADLNASAATPGKRTRKAGSRKKADDLNRSPAEGQATEQAGESPEAMEQDPAGGRHSEDEPVPGVL